MGIIKWFKNISKSVSASIIIKDIKCIIDVVERDLDYASNNTDKMLAFIKDPNHLDSLTETEISGYMEYMKEYRSRKLKVSEAQKNLYKDISVWSSLSFEQCFNEIIIPSLLSGGLINKSNPAYEPVIIAVYRVCVEAARQNGLCVEKSTPTEILQIMQTSGDIYK